MFDAKGITKIKRGNLPFGMVQEGAYSLRRQGQWYTLRMARSRVKSPEGEVKSIRPTLLLDGDAIEKSSWPGLRNYFPYYEEFWRMHLYPLRSSGSIYLRRGIDEDFEFLAMFHYSAFVNLVGALEKISKASQNLFFPGDIYTTLYAANELAGKVIEKWSAIYQECERRDPQINTTRLEELGERFRKYRNRIHEQLPAVVLDAYSVRIPRPEKMDSYVKWTDVLYANKPEDFIEVGIQVNNDFRSLCSALQNAWKEMCELSAKLLKNQDYMQKRGKGESVTLRASFVVQSVSSNTSLAYSPTAVAAVLPSPGSRFDKGKR